MSAVAPEAAFTAAVEAAEATHAEEAAVALRLVRGQAKRLLRDDFISRLFDDVFNNAAKHKALRPFFVGGGLPATAADVSAYYDTVESAIADTVNATEAGLDRLLGSLCDILVSHARAVLLPGVKRAATWLVVQDRHDSTQALHERVTFVESEFGARMTMIANHEARELSTHVTGAVLGKATGRLRVGVAGRGEDGASDLTDEELSGVLDECARCLKPDTLKRMSADEAKEQLLRSHAREASAWARVDDLQKRLADHQVGDAQRQRDFEKRTLAEAEAAVARARDDAAAVATELNRTRQHHQGLQEGLLAASELIASLDERLALTNLRFKSLCDVAVAEGRLPPAFAAAERALSELQLEWESQDRREAASARVLQREGALSFRDEPPQRAATDVGGGAPVNDAAGYRASTSSDETPTAYFRCLARVRAAMAASTTSTGSGGDGDDDDGRAQLLADAARRIGQQRLLTDCATLPPARVSEQQRGIVEALLDVGQQRNIAVGATREVARLTKAVAAEHDTGLRKAEQAKAELRAREVELTQRIETLCADNARLRHRADDIHAKLQEATVLRFEAADETGIVDDLVRKLRARDAEVLVLRHQLARGDSTADLEGADARSGAATTPPPQPPACADDDGAGQEARLGSASDAAEARRHPAKPPPSRPASAVAAAARVPAAGATCSPSVGLDRRWLVDTPLSLSRSSSRPVSATRPKTARPASASTAPRQHQMGIYTAADTRADVMRPRSAHTPRSRQLKAALQASTGPATQHSPRTRPPSASSKRTTS